LKEGAIAMTFRVGLAVTAVVPAFVCLTCPEAADACLDQGTGSAVLQVLMGVLVGGLFAANHFKSQIMSVWKRLSSRGGQVDTTED
jgi:hypothetical protein